MSQCTEHAKTLYLEKGYCCSESIWLAFAKKYQLEPDLTDAGNRLAFSFCGGGGSAKLCGALAGGMLVLGQHFGRNPDQPRNPDLTKYTKELFTAFEQQYHKHDCSDLKPVAQPEVAKQVCAGYLVFVVQKLEEMLDRDYPLPEEVCP